MKRFKLHTNGDYSGSAAIAFDAPSNLLAQSLVSKQKLQVKEILRRMDQILLRTKFISKEMARHNNPNNDKTQSRHQRMNQMCELMRIMANKVKAVTVLLQEMLLNGVIMSDHKLQHEIIALHTQLRHLVSTLESDLQCLEQMAAYQTTELSSNG